MFIFLPTFVSKCLLTLDDLSPKMALARFGMKEHFIEIYRIYAFRNKHFSRIQLICHARDNVNLMLLSQVCPFKSDNK